LNAVRCNEWKVHFAVLQRNIATGTRGVMGWPTIIHLRSDPYERAPHESGMNIRWYADNLWLFVPIQQKIKGFFVDFEQYPSQASSSLNTSVQAALLEAMEERQVTVAGKTHRLPELFMVLATQNPIEQEGTYPLPEAQRDRFLLHIMVRYPSDPDELNVMRLVRGEETEHTAGPATTSAIWTGVSRRGRASRTSASIARNATDLCCWSSISARTCFSAAGVR
jgi:hypothetical protein